MFTLLQVAAEPGVCPAGARAEEGLLDRPGGAVPGAGAEERGAGGARVHFAEGELHAAAGQHQTGSLQILVHGHPWWQYGWAQCCSIFSGLSTRVP